MSDQCCHRRYGESRRISEKRHRRDGVESSLSHSPHRKTRYERPWFAWRRALMKTKDSITRRRLIESTATTLLLMPLLRVFRETEAYGQGVAEPNAIFVYFGAGSYRDSFFPKGNANGIDSFPIVTAPLAAHKNDLTFFQGLSTRGASNHYGGPKQVFAGWTQGYAGANAMPYSLDQMLADRIGKNSRKKLVNVGVMSTLDGASAEAVSYNAAGASQPAQDNPKAAYDDIFGGFTPSNLSGSSGLALANEQVVSGKKRVIDFVRGDMKRIKGSLGPIEGQIFEAHVTALDELYTDIVRLEEIEKGKDMGRATNGGNTGGSTKPSRCDPKALEALLPTGSNQGWYQKTEISASVSKFNRRLIVEALACGITKVATMQYGFSDCGREFCFEGTPITGIGYHSNTHANTADLHNIQAAIMKEVASIIADLKSIKVGDKTLFDQTLIMTSSDMGDNPNNHDGVSIP
ncbi:MAG: DUF1552 domain-containing protein, partial [Proteobacteria bacterium]